MLILVVVVLAGAWSTLALLPGTNYRTVVWTDPQHGQVERSYLLYIPASYSLVLPQQPPVPLLLNFHGWTSSGQNNMETESQFHLLAEEFGFVSVWVDGVPDSPSGWRSWNIGREAGQYGDVCDRDRDYWGLYECHYSCEDCDPRTTCKAGMTCYNDLAFVEWLVGNLTAELSIDPARLHATGFSNGAQFTYYLASYSTIEFASLGIVSGSPLLGFGPLPARQVNIIDFHGLQDESIPYSVDWGYGRGPAGAVETIISSDGLYYYDKAQYLQYLAEGWGCQVETGYNTPMDGVEGWACSARHCSRGRGLVSCTGQYSHGYPFTWDKLQGSRIIWQFMESFIAK